MKKQLLKIISTVAIATTLVFAPVQQDNTDAAQLEQPPVVQPLADPGGTVRP